MKTETRNIKLVDLPLVSRLMESGTPLDSEMAYTGKIDLSSAALIARFFLPQRNVYSLLSRAGSTHVVGQFRIGANQTARIVYLAPGLAYDQDNTAWLHVLDAITASAGQRGAHILTAEVDEHLMLFETMRVAGFSIYARQEIWQRRPGPFNRLPYDAVELTEETANDSAGIHNLYCNIVPRLVQQVAVPPTDSTGLVYRKNDRVEGYVAVSEGKTGIYLTPYLHPDVFSEAGAILTASIEQGSRSYARQPVFVAVRRYQDWLEDALVDMGFEPWTRQALMVRHIAAGVHQTSFEPLSHKLEANTNPINPPTVPSGPAVQEFNEE